MVRPRALRLFGQGIFTTVTWKRDNRSWSMVVAALWAPMRCNWHRTPVPPSLPRQAATMRRTSTRSEPAGLSIIERRSSRRFCERQKPGASRRRSHGKLVLRVA